MSAWLDLLPIAAFFLADRLAGLYVATAVLIVATLIQLVVQYRREGRVHPLLIIGSGLVFVMGGLTLWAHDVRFLLYKPSVVYLGLALSFWFFSFDGRQSIVSRMLASHLIVSEYSCERANRWLIAIFVALSVANIGHVLLYGQTGFGLWLLSLKALSFVAMAIVIVLLARRGVLLDAVNEPESGS